MGIKAVAKMTLHAAGFWLGGMPTEDEDRITEYERRIAEHERRIAEHECRLNEEERKNLSFIKFLYSLRGGSEIARRLVGYAVLYLS
jgi:hypothetical protein